MTVWESSRLKFFLLLNTVTVPTSSVVFITLCSSTRLTMTDQQYDADCSTSKLLSATLSEEDEEPFFRQSRPRHSTVKCLAKYCLAAFLCIAAGAMVGYYSARLLPGSLTIACSGINSRTPIPRAVFTNRLDVPFIPNREFMGPSQEADRNWARITEGAE